MHFWSPLGYSAGCPRGVSGCSRPTLRRIFSVKLIPPSLDSQDLLLTTLALLQTKPLLRALLNSEFVFVREDPSSLPLSQQYRGKYKVLERKDKYFKLQIGSKLDNISVDRRKPVFSDENVSLPLPPPRGRPPRRLLPPVISTLAQAVKKVNKAVHFSIPTCRNPFWAAKIRSFVSAIFRLSFWEEVM